MHLCRIHLSLFAGGISSLYVTVAPLAAAGDASFGLAPMLQGAGDPGHYFPYVEPPVLLAQEGLEHGGQKTNKHGKNRLKSKAVAQDQQYVGDSERNRQDKKFVVLGEIGLINVLNSAYGVQGGYFLTPKEILELDYVHGNFSFFGFTSKIDLMTARLKYFVGNSFYLQGGAGYRHIESTDNGDPLGLTSALGAQASTSDFQASHLVGEFGLGNRWQFGSAFTLGCDWVGYIQPIAKLSSSESFTGDWTDAGKTAQRNDFTTQQGGNLLLVRFHLGWAF